MSIHSSFYMEEIHITFPKCNEDAIERGFSPDQATRKFLIRFNGLWMKGMGIPCRRNGK